MNGNIGCKKNAVWFVVGRAFQKFAEIPNVITVDAFLLAVMSHAFYEFIGIAIVGQGLSSSELDFMHALQALNPNLKLVSAETTPMLQENNVQFASHMLMQVTRLDEASYQASLNLQDIQGKYVATRIPMSTVLDSAKELLRYVLNLELKKSNMEIIIKQVTCQEKNALFPIQTKIELKVTQLIVKGERLSVKSHVRFYQSSHISFEVFLAVEVALLEDFLSEEKVLAQKTLNKYTDFLSYDGMI